VGSFLPTIDQIFEELAKPIKASGISRQNGQKRGVAIFAKAFMGIPAQQAAKITRPLLPAAAPAVLLLSLDTQQGVPSIILAMTRRDVGKPAFSLRKKRFVKTHALSLLGTTRLRATSEACHFLQGESPCLEFKGMNS